MVVCERGDLWWADLPEPEGAGPGGRRPVLVVQSDAFNRSRIATTIVVVLTSNLGRGEAPGNVLISARQSGLPKDSVASVSQVFTIDKEMLAERVGSLSGPLMRRVDKGLRLTLHL